MSLDLTVGLNEFIALAIIIFSLGLFTVMTRSNAIALLMGVELILNSSNILFAAFQRFLFPEGSVYGQAMAIFVILLAAAEAAVALGIVIALYQNLKSVDIRQLDNLNE